MTTTLDLGADQAHRHSAEVAREMQTLGMERIAVTCECGELWLSVYPEGTYDRFENDEQGETAPYLWAWENHVRRACGLAAVEGHPGHGRHGEVGSDLLLEMIADLTEERDEARAEQAKAEAFLESDEGHELCIADVEDLKGRLRTARRVLAIVAVAAAVVIVALVVAVVAG